MLFRLCVSLFWKEKEPIKHGCCPSWEIDEPASSRRLPINYTWPKRVDWDLRVETQSKVEGNKNLKNRPKEAKTQQQTDQYRDLSIFCNGLDAADLWVESILYSDTVYIFNESIVFDWGRSLGYLISFSYLKKGVFWRSAADGRIGGRQELCLTTPAVLFVHNSTVTIIRRQDRLIHNGHVVTLCSTRDDSKNRSKWLAR